MKTLLVLTIIYVFVGGLFYFNGFYLIGGNFFVEVKSIEKIGEQVPLALGMGLVYLWVLVVCINRFNISQNHVKVASSDDLVASSKDSSH